MNDSELRLESLKYAINTRKPSTTPPSIEELVSRATMVYNFLNPDGPTEPQVEPPVFIPDPSPNYRRLARATRVFIAFSMFVMGVIVGMSILYWASI